MIVLDIQRRLKALGFNPGALDDAWGPATRKAVEAFQRSAGLAVDGVVGPQTVKALNAHATLAKPSVTRPPILKVGEPIWVLEGRRKMGLHEKLNSAALKRWLKSDGATVGDPAVVPWCGDFVETCIRLALPDEKVPTNPYFARNWLTFGVKCPEPVVGAIAVFERGPKNGHVGFVVGQDATGLSILGGNQGNSISVSNVAKKRLLGCRWPVTAGRIVVAPMAAATGVVSTDEA